MRQKKSDSMNVLNLFKSPRLRKVTLILIILWMLTSVVFDGHVRNVGALGLDFFVTFTIACATELPADVFLTMVLDKWGRRWMMCGTMVVSGIFSLISTIFPAGTTLATFALLGRLSINISYTLGMQYASELLPTVIRAQGLALIHNMGYVATILSPFIVHLVVLNPILPLILLGILSVIGGCLSLFLPDTIGCELPQTLQDGEEFGKDQQFLDFPCIKKKRNKKVIFRRAAPETSSIMRTSIRGEYYRSKLLQQSIN